MCNLLKYAFFFFLLKDWHKLSDWTHFSIKREQSSEQGIDKPTCLVPRFNMDPIGFGESGNWGIHLGKLGKTWERRAGTRWWHTPLKPREPVSHGSVTLSSDWVMLPREHTHLLGTCQGPLRLLHSVWSRTWVSVRTQILCLGTIYLTFRNLSFLICKLGWSWDLPKRVVAGINLDFLWKSWDTVLNE